MTLYRYYALILAGLFPIIVHAQALTVMGGGQKARECFMNAELAAQRRHGISRAMLAPCDYTLELAKLTRQDRAATFANRGIVYAALNNFDAAMADYDTAIAIRPSAPEFYLNRGNSFFMMREFGNAMSEYEHSLELGIKQLHFAHFNRGMAFERLGNDVGAQAAYELALQHQPDWDLARDKLALVNQRLQDAAAQDVGR